MSEGGIILVDKPYGWTSFDVVKKIKNNQKLKKVGHAGTLDPLATGLLILCHGQWTKKIEIFQNYYKIYTGTITIGKTTPSYDLETDFDKIYDKKDVTNEEIYDVRGRFLGEIKQTPPIYSAVKIKGKRLYNLARSNKIINQKQIKTRNVNIFEFDIKKISLPNIDFKIKCSKGTYIRSIAHDFGRILKTGAYLSNLRRVQIGKYTIENAIKI